MRSLVIILFLILFASSFSRIEPKRARQQYPMIPNEVLSIFANASRGQYEQTGSMQLFKRSDEINGESGKKFVYIISPISDQIIDVESGLRGEEGNPFNENVYTKLFRLGQKSTTHKPPTEDESLNECHTVRSTMELVKEEVDKKSKVVIRTCRGLVQVNKCEGWCSSTAEPSIKMQSGFKKNCQCCNEGSFRTIQIRLNECYRNGLYGIGAIRHLKEEPSSYMDITIEEPTDCKCRSCDGGY